MYQQVASNVAGTTSRIRSWSQLKSSSTSQAKLHQPFSQFLQVYYSRQLAPAARPATSVATTAQHDVRLIVTDVDGTLLNSQQKLTPKVQAAVKRAAELGVPLVVATGKARGPWTRDVLPALGLTTPGVFLQGLLICDGEGQVLHEQLLPAAVMQDCIRLAAEQGLTLTAYCGDRILCAQTDKHTDRLLFYREPTPEAIGDLAVALQTAPAHKMIFMAEQSRIDLLRPKAEQMLQGRASLTTALEGMLEVLPLGASKGNGVAWLLNYMGIEAKHTMALGDGENDVEMLQLAGLGVAMGNAGPKAKKAAAVTVSSNDDDGVAEAIERFVLLSRAASVR